jgi:hypothetical protein
MLRTDYRLTVDRNNGEFSFYLTPYGINKCSFVDVQVEGQLFFRREFKGELIFKDEDYGYMKDRYDNGYYCDYYEILIEKKISGVYVTDWIGYFSMLDGKFDFTLCEFRVTPIVKDKYDCILKNGDIKINILNQDKTTVTSWVKSKIEFIPVSLNTNQMGLFPFALGDVVSWATWQEFQVIDYQQLYLLSPLGWLYYHTKLCARETVLLPIGATPVGSNWVNIDQETSFAIFTILADESMPIMNYLEKPDGMSKWARRSTDCIANPIAANIIYSISNINYSSTCNYMGEFITKGTIATQLKLFLNIQKTWYDHMIFTQTLQYTRCLPLLSTIKYVLTQTCPDDFDANTQIISDFFTNATNPVTGLASKTNSIFLLQKSDAKRPSASNPATLGEITFNELMNALYCMFQIWWYLDADNYLNLIHQSEISNNLGLDITQQPYINSTIYKQQFEFNKDLMYRYETWQFMEADGKDFKGVSIEYLSTCVSKDDAKREKKYLIPSITTDLAFIQVGSDKVSDDGFVMIATEPSIIYGGWSVLFETGILSTYSELNGHLSVSALQDKYWRHYRILIDGLMNGIQTTFISSQEIRKLIEHSIIYCDNNFDPMDLIITELGNAKVNTSEFKLFDNTLILSLSV